MNEEYGSAVRITGDTSDIQKKLFNLNKTLAESTKLVVGNQAAFTTLGSRAVKSIKALDSTFAKFRTSLGVTSVAMAGIFAQSNIKFRAYEKKIAQIKTLGVKTSNAEIIRELDKLIIQFGLTDAAAGDAYYNLISASVQATDVTRVMTTAIKLAQSGNTDLGKAIDIVTSGLNSWNKAGYDATRVANAINLTFVKGKTTVEELSSVFGVLAPLVSAAGGEIEDLSGVMATLTSSIKTNEAATGFKAMLTNINQETKESTQAVARANKAFQGLDLDFSIAGLEKDGFGDFFEKISKATKGGRLDLLRAFFPSREAQSSVSFLTKNIDKLKQNLAEHGDVINGYSQVSNTFYKQFDRLIGAYGVSTRKITAAISDDLSTVIDKIIPVMGFFAEIIQTYPGLVKIAAAVTAIATAWSFMGGIKAGIFTLLFYGLSKFIGSFDEITSKAVIALDVIRLEVDLFFDRMAHNSYVDPIIKNIKKIKTEITNLFKNGWDDALSGISKFIQTVKNFFYGLYVYLVGNSVVPDIVDEITDHFVNGWDKALEGVNGFALKVKNVFKDIHNTSKNAGLNLIVRTQEEGSALIGKPGTRVAKRQLEAEPSEGKGFIHEQIATAFWGEAINNSISRHLLKLESVSAGEELVNKKLQGIALANENVFKAAHDQARDVRKNADLGLKNAELKLTDDLSEKQKSALNKKIRALKIELLEADKDVNKAKQALDNRVKKYIIRERTLANRVNVLGDRFDKLDRQVINSQSSGATTQILKNVSGYTKAKFALERLVFGKEIDKVRLLLSQQIGAIFDRIGRVTIGWADSLIKKLAVGGKGLLFGGSNVVDTSKKIDQQRILDNKKRIRFQSERRQLLIKAIKQRNSILEILKETRAAGAKGITPQSVDFLRASTKVDAARERLQTQVRRQAQTTQAKGTRTGFKPSAGQFRGLGVAAIKDGTLVFLKSIKGLLYALNFLSKAFAPIVKLVQLAGSITFTALKGTLNVSGISKAFSVLSAVARKVLLPIMAIYDAYQGATDIGIITEINGLDDTHLKKIVEDKEALEKELKALKSKPGYSEKAVAAIKEKIKYQDGLYQAEIKNMGIDIFARIKSAIANAIGSFMNSFPHLLGTILETFGAKDVAAVLKKVDIKSSLVKIIDVVSNVFQTALNVLKAPLALLNFFTGEDSDEAKARKAISGEAESSKGLFSIVLQKILDLLENTLDVILTFSKAIKDLTSGDLGGFFGSLFEALHIALLTVLPGISQAYINKVKARYVVDRKEEKLQEIQEERIKQNILVSGLKQEFNGLPQSVKGQNKDGKFNIHQTEKMFQKLKHAEEQLKLTNKQEQAATQALRLSKEDLADADAATKRKKIAREEAIIDTIAIDPDKRTAEQKINLRNAKLEKEKENEKFASKNPSDNYHLLPGYEHPQKTKNDEFINAANSPTPVDLRQIRKDRAYDGNERTINSLVKQLAAFFEPYKKSHIRRYGGSTMPADSRAYAEPIKELVSRITFLINRNKELKSLDNPNPHYEKIGELLALSSRVTSKGYVPQSIEEYKDKEKNNFVKDIVAQAVVAETLIKGIAGSKQPLTKDSFPNATQRVLENVVKLVDLNSKGKGALTYYHYGQDIARNRFKTDEEKENFDKKVKPFNFFKANNSLIKKMFNDPNARKLVKTELDFFFKRNPEYNKEERRQIMNFQPWKDGYVNEFISKKENGDAIQAMIDETGHLNSGKKLNKYHKEGNDSVIDQAFNPYRQLQNTLGQFTITVGKFGQLIANDKYDFPKDKMDETKGFRERVVNVINSVTDTSTNPDYSFPLGLFLAKDGEFETTKEIFEGANESNKIAIAQQKETNRILSGVLTVKGANVEPVNGFKFATGGSVSGPGTGTSDSIPIMASNGEFVVNAKSTSENLPLLERLNNGEHVIAASTAKNNPSILEQINQSKSFEEYPWYKRWVAQGFVFLDDFAARNLGQNKYSGWEEEGPRFDIIGYISAGLDKSFLPMAKKRKAANKSVDIEIDSAGGDTAPSFAIADFLQGYRNNSTHIMDNGEAKSSAAHMWLSGNTRTASEGSTLGLHASSNYLMSYISPLASLIRRRLTGADTILAKTMYESGFNIEKIAEIMKLSGSQVMNFNKEQMEGLGLLGKNKRVETTESVMSKLKDITSNLLGYKLQPQQDVMDARRQRSKQADERMLKKYKEGKKTPEEIRHWYRKFPKVLQRLRDLELQKYGENTFANGGLVSGHGTATSDSIPAMLSNKEFVVNAKQTAKFRPLLEAINSGIVSHLSTGTTGYASIAKSTTAVDTAINGTDFKAIQDRLDKIAALNKEFIKATDVNAQTAIETQIRQLEATKVADDTVISAVKNLRALHTRYVDAVERKAKDSGMTPAEAIKYINENYSFGKEIVAGVNLLTRVQAKKDVADAKANAGTPQSWVFGNESDFQNWKKQYINATDSVTGAFREGFLKEIRKTNIGGTNFSGAVTAGWKLLETRLRTRLFGVGEAYISNGFATLEHAGDKILTKAFSSIIPSQNKEDRDKRDRGYEKDGNTIADWFTGLFGVEGDKDKKDDKSNWLTGLFDVKDDKDKKDDKDMSVTANNVVVSQQGMLAEQNLGFKDKYGAMFGSEQSNMLAEQDFGFKDRYGAMLGGEQSNMLAEQDLDFADTEGNNILNMGFNLLGGKLDVGNEESTALGGLLGNLLGGLGGGSSGGGGFFEQLVSAGVSALTGGVSFASNGGIVTANGIKPLYLNNGGFVPKGSDTVPAMLTPGEIVFNPAKNKMGGQTINQTYSVSIAGDFDAEAQKRFKKLVSSNSKLITASNIYGERSQTGLGR